MAPCPVPREFAVNRAGAVASTSTGNGSDRTPWRSTRTFTTGFSAARYGTAAEHWCSDTYTRGAAAPSKRILTPSITLPTMPLGAAAVWLSSCAGPRSVPQTTTIWPGAIGAWYDAASVTAVTTGFGPACAAGTTSSVIEYAGKTALTEPPATSASGWRTIELRSAPVLRQT